MNVLGDMQLFVKVVHCSGLAAAGRELGLSPASMTSRIKALEKRYQVKLLTRTTRSISLTDEGREFYKDCLSIIADVDHAETKLRSGKESLSGPLRITAPADLGQQHISKVLKEFIEQHPKITPYLELNDAISNLKENSLDLGIRYGASSDTSLVTKKLTRNWRVLVASPEYLEKHGTPNHIQDLQQHACLAMIRSRIPLKTWYFDNAEGEKSVQINPTWCSNDGAQIRRWAVAGKGIALKSIWDVANDIKAKRLVILLDRYTHNYTSKDISLGTDMHVAYPSREYLPQRTRVFIDLLTEYFAEQSTALFNTPS